MSVVKSHFKTLTEAERFADRQIERVFELADETGRWVQFGFEHDQSNRLFRLTFLNPQIADHEVSYELDNLHVYVEEDAA